MVNVKVKKSPKQKRIVQKKKQSERKITSSEKQQRVKKAANNSVKKPAKGTTNKRIKTKVTAQKKPLKKNLNKGVYKEKDTLRIRRTNISELKKVENVIEKLSKKPEPSVRVTVPGVLRIASSVPKTVPSAQKAISIVEIKNYLRRLFGSNA
ncbi:MAG: hypothetical protein SCARUB_01742 [Candidatus Scalindua rubra]|uniref:Uncharacterized protein n=1 Tax=Candidatus Scalindua rubra TaxID=1872076 RepID=A0A1E3XBY8_9BACT|nr:MAG: hypothetical protein SCARUB_01742 [Candidatus Scalindua rubra]